MKGLFVANPQNIMVQIASGQETTVLPVARPVNFRDQNRIEYKTKPLFSHMPINQVKGMMAASGRSSVQG